MSENMTQKGDFWALDTNKSERPSQYKTKDVYNSSDVVNAAVIENEEGTIEYLIIAQEMGFPTAIYIYKFETLEHSHTAPCTIMGLQIHTYVKNLIW